MMMNMNIHQKLCDYLLYAFQRNEKKIEKEKVCCVQINNINLISYFIWSETLNAYTAEICFKFTFHQYMCEEVPCMILTCAALCLVH